jgi:hypothetical protein
MQPATEGGRTHFFNCCMHIHIHRIMIKFFFSNMNLLLVLCLVLRCCHLWFESVEVLPYLLVSGLIECCESGSVAKVAELMSFSSSIVLVYLYLKWYFIHFVLFISVE